MTRDYPHPHPPAGQGRSAQVAGAIGCCRQEVDEQEGGEGEPRVFLGGNIPTADQAQYSNSQEEAANA